MPFFGIVWVTSWLSCLLASSQGLQKVPDYLTGAFPARVLSVVSRTVEIPYRRVVKTQFYSGIWSGNSYVSIVSNRKLNTAALSYQVPIQLAQIAAGSTLPSNAVEESLCSPELQAQKQEYPQTSPRPSTPLLQPASEPQTSARKLSKSAIYNRILYKMHNIVPWRQRPQAVKKPSTKSVVVVSTRSWEEVGAKSNSEGWLVKPGFWLFSKLLTARAFATLPPGDREHFQVWLKGHIVAQLPKQQQATLMARRLKRFFQEKSSPEVRALAVEPALVDEVPAVKLGTHLLFKVDDSLAAGMERNRELLAVEWANNLRVAQGKPPLQLAQAQRQMYNLVETSTMLNGVASWYGPYFHGRLTANGEIFNQYELTAAHRSLPFNTYLQVTNLKSGKVVIVRINDRGPYIKGRNLDLSRKAARCIKSEKRGIVPFRAVILRSPSTQSQRDILSN
ncbi:MAG: septal ring lytic transglycosylase RlpA family protein [Symploca sp. SIO3C6]|uniref:Probable endolytic peptidoglycan transglycosylase RlpA n=1 Tax=Symploca sp. SIO1C4 TaxID=2607765 RepID=A0A6B3NG21_9CYAN|nr:septal ring lytic transglycosylase RlpA family protein [Symploca sp. SIO3C6]NER29855.1 septal ring lytic transglycosylase RlpA family protein [Symploca sp. SIO1C4]NET07392.1 septal ring lytic transglycosylase RlpA family protein [Symploca sp. SIO2B6]